MKAFRIFLLVLIIIGLALIDTRHMWLPSVVGHVTASDVPYAVVPVEEIQPNVTLVDGRQCYTYSKEATADAPYTVSEFIDLTITGDKVSGTKRGTQSGPDMNNGYSGTITGTKSDDKITSVFAYKIEGSANKEQEIYRTNKVGIEKLRYPLKESKGILAPDTTKDFTALSYAQVSCSGSN